MLKYLQRKKTTEWNFDQELSRGDADDSDSDSDGNTSSSGADGSDDDFDLGPLLVTSQSTMFYPIVLETSEK